MLQILLSEGHPEACTFDGRIVDDQRLNLLMVQQVTVARTNIRIGQILVNLQWLCLNPLAIFPIETLLGNLADINLRIEVSGESLMVVACVTVHDIQILNLLEMMLGSIGRIDAGDTWVEATAEDSSKTGFLETFAIGPLPRVFKVCLILRLIVGCVQITASASQTGVHDCQILIWQSEVDDQFRLVFVKQSLQLLHIVSIHLSCLDIQLVSGFMNVVYNLVTFRLTTTGNHKLRKHVSVLCNLKRCYCCDATSANH